MLDLYYSGGPLFMGILTVLALLVLGTTLLAARGLLDGAGARGPRVARWVHLVLQFGLLAFFSGILAQAMGLIQMLQAVEAAGDISPALLFGGLKVSMIAPMYGLVIFIAAFILWMGLKYVHDASAHAE